MTTPIGRVVKRIGVGVVGLLLAATLPPAAFAATGAVSLYAMSPSPIAAPASLAAGGTVSITVSAETSTNTLVPGAVVYLSFTQAVGGGTATVGTTALSKTPVAFTATTGTLTVTYTAPAVLPASGRDTIKAADAKSLPTISATDSYEFAAPISYVMSPDPIAAPASLAASATVPITLTAENASALPIPGATVYLSFVPATGGGSAAVGTTPLTSTPTAFVVGTTGQLTVTYQAPAVLPTTGTDTIVAQQTQTGSKRTDSYSFGKLASLSFSPSPIAAGGSLTAGQVVVLTLAAKDATGNPVAGQALFLTFVPATNGGSASVGTRALSATPIQTKTDGSGQVVITYTASSTTPVGTDTITAANATTAATVSASDTYSASPVGPLNHLVLSPATSTVNPNVAQAYTATGYDAANNVIGDVTSATTFSIVGGTCSANSCSASTAGDHMVTGKDGSATGTATLSVTGVLGVSSGDTYHPLTPTRLLDTRNGTGGLGVFHSHVAQGFQVTGGVVPTGATAVTGNLTVTQQTSLGFLYVGPAPVNDPTSSNLNFPLNDDRANAVTVMLSASGQLFVTYAAPVPLTPTAQVLFDVSGYFVIP